MFKYDLSSLLVDLQNKQYSTVHMKNWVTETEKNIQGSDFFLKSVPQWSSDDEQYIVSQSNLVGCESFRFMWWLHAAVL